MWGLGCRRAAASRTDARLGQPRSPLVFRAIRALSRPRSHGGHRLCAGKLSLRVSFDRRDNAMTIPGQGPEDTQELRVRLSRYNDGGLIRKAAMRLAGDALTPDDR